MAQTEKESGNVNYFYILIVILAVFFGYLLYQYLTPDTVEPKIKIVKVAVSQFPSVKMHNIGKLSTMPVEINGSKGYFIIDTGAEESVFNSSFKDLLEVQFLDSLLVPNHNISMTDTLQVNVDSLFVLNKTFYSYNLEKLTTELVKVDSLNKAAKIFGILGQDALNEYGLILNYQNRKVYITKNN